jgi:hypothetical protein
MRYWPHLAEIPLIREPTEIPHNVLNVFMDGSKIGGKVGAAAVKDLIVQGVCEILIVSLKGFTNFSDLHMSPITLVCRIVN